MDSIAEIHIGDSTGGVHHFCAGRAPVVVGVAGSIDDSVVGFCFCDEAAGECSIDKGEESFSKKRSSEMDDIGVLVESRIYFARDHSLCCKM